jgi:hypothetical protein
MFRSMTSLMARSSEVFEWVAIIIQSTLCAMIYGIVHDLVSVTMWHPHLSVYHPPIFGGTKNLLLLALGWGSLPPGGSGRFSASD